MRYWTSLVFTCLVSAALVCGCVAKKRSVKRVKPGEAPELTGKWSATDAHEVSEALIKDCFGSPWLLNFVEEQSRKPAVRVDRIVNKTSEHIDAQVFIKNLEKAMVNSGKVSVLAQRGAELNSVNTEEDYATEGRVADGPVIGEQKGGDFVLTVHMTSIEEQLEGEQVRFYKFSATLNNATTAEKVWIGDHEIQKYIEQAKVTW
ncbi:penicillin-binding protein activator LpoB [Myxococcota bacterium]